jgi:choline kinase
MKVIILAAGVGRRLGENQKQSPKCLLRIGEQSLLERHLECLQGFQIEEIFITVGYQAKLIEAEISRLNPQIKVTTVYNSQYSKGSLISLWTMHDTLTSGTDILLMDADVLYDYRIIKVLMQTKTANCFLLDRDFEPGEEPVKICVNGGTLVEFRKQISPGLIYDDCGESVGFFRLSSHTATRLAQCCERYRSQGLDDAPYEEAIRDLLLETPNDFGHVDITGLPWIEIDFPEDLDRAEREILPMIN